MNNADVIEFFKSALEEQKQERKELKTELKKELKNINEEITEIKKELAVSNALAAVFDIPKVLKRIEDLESKENSRTATEKQNNTEKRLKDLELWRSGLAASLAISVAIFWYIMANLDKLT